MGAAQIQGYAARGFEPLVEVFEDNFRERGELGAAFAAAQDGLLVVDLWGGIADSRTAKSWRRDTLQVIFSGTKGLVAICLLILIDRGKLDLDLPVASYWPEFAAAGKGEVTVREIVTHTASMPGFEIQVPSTGLTDHDRMAALLAEQPQMTDPRAPRVYHPLTFGWLCGEILRRIDGRGIGSFFAEEVAAPLDLDLFIGLPPEHEDRVAWLELAANWNAEGFFSSDNPDDLVRAVWGNPPTFAADSFAWNKPAIHAAELPGANAIGTARSVARLYSSLRELISPEVLSLGVSELESRQEALFEIPQRFGVGFELQSEHLKYGPPPDAFGHGGAGGSMHGAWPSLGIGFSYAMNLMRDDQENDVDPRSQALLDALFECLPGWERQAVGPG